MTTRTFADNTRPPIINTVTIKHFSKLDFQSKREVNNGETNAGAKMYASNDGTEDNSIDYT